MLAAISDLATVNRLAAERAFLKALDGSCQTPIAGLAELSGGTVMLRGEILRTDGSAAHASSIDGPIEDAAKIGGALAKALLDKAGPGFLEH